MCPTTGVYLFFYSVYGFYITQGSTRFLVSASLYIGGESVSQIYYNHDNSQETRITLSHKDIVACQAGQRVWVECESDRNYLGGSIYHTQFGGVLLYTT